MAELALGDEQRRFLFLEGPHGPFFRLLAGALVARGCAVHRVLMNAADTAEWGRRLPATRYRGALVHFEAWLEDLIAEQGITDLVLYGDGRPVHRRALTLARRLGLGTHILEEGYVRPRNITYERQGTNGFSRLCEVSLPEMAEVVGQAGPPNDPSADTWGDSRQHIWFSLLYFLRVIFSGSAARHYFAERHVSLWSDAAWYVMRAAASPYLRLARWLKKRRLTLGERQFHLILLQLSFDASMKVHSDYPDTATFIEEVIDAFVEGAPPDHLLVFKAHPFENGRERLGAIIRAISRDLGVADRIVFINGGKRLARLMDAARTVVTVNSTGAQQALWRGLPVAARGRSIYRKHGLTSEQSLAAFFRHPRRPDLRAYWIFRAFMMRTTQIRGSFYARPGIRRLLGALPEAMLADRDPFDVLARTAGKAPAGGSAEVVPRSGKNATDRANPIGVQSRAAE